MYKVACVCDLVLSMWHGVDVGSEVEIFGKKNPIEKMAKMAGTIPYELMIIDEEAAEVVRLIFRLFIGGKNRNQIAVHLKNEQISTPTFYMKDRGRGTCKNKTLNEDNRCKWNKATLTHISFSF